MSFDWSGRYRAGRTPWDLGTVHPEIAARLASGELGPPGGALVPGCGRGHDALALARAGFEVLAADVVPELASSVAPELERLGGRFAVADALALRPERPFDLLLEHTFFCALDPSTRAAYGDMARACLSPGGRLAALVFPADRPDELGGPPFRATTEDLAAALGEGFRLVTDEPVSRPGPGRRWAERFALFERRPEDDRSAGR